MEEEEANGRKKMAWIIGRKSEDEEKGKNRKEERRPSRKGEGM